MATESSTSSSFPVFIDTNLDTHLSFMINRDDTVAQVKGRIMSEHPRCFPQIGEISVEALKVKLGEIYYHLVDSMIVRFALEHIEGVRILNIDLVPALCTINNHTKNKFNRAAMGDNDVLQPQNCTRSINHNANLLSTRSEVYHLESIPDDMESKKGIFPNFFPKEHEITTLPGACEQIPSELGTAQIEEQAISGAHVLQSFDNDSDIINKNARVELEQKNAAVKAKKDAPLVSNKNEKYQKHNSSLHGDDILSEKDHGGKRKHRKDKDVNIDSFHKAASQFDSSMQDHSKLKRKKKKVLSSNDEHPQHYPVEESPKVDNAAKENQTTENFVEVMVSNSKDMGKESEIVVPKEASSLHKNIPQVESLGQAGVDAKRKRRKKVLVEPPLNKLINNSLDEIDASAQETPTNENHVEEITGTHVKLGTNSEIAVTRGHGSSDKVNATFKEIQAQEIQVQENQVKEMIPQNNPVDESLPKIDAVAKENQTTENFVEVMVRNNKDIGKESKIVVPKEANSLHSNVPQVESLGHAGVDAKRKKRKKVHEEPPQNKLINSLDEVDASVQEKPIKENCVEEIINTNVKLGKNSKIAVTHGHDLLGKVNATFEEIQAQEIQVQENHVEEMNKEKNHNKNTAADSSVDDSQIILSPVDKKKRRTHKKKEKTEPLVQELQSSEVVNSSVDQITFDLPKAPSVNHLENSSTGLKGKGVVENISNDKKPKRSRKKSERIEQQEPNMQSDTQETVNSTVDQVKENLTKVPPVNHHENSSTELVGKGVHEDISNDKKPKRSRKKSEKIEQEEANVQSDTREIVNSTVDRATENSMRELFDNPTKVMEATTVEAAACDKKPKRSRKRTANIELEHLTAAGDHPIMDTTVQVKPSDQKSKCSKKKLEKVDFPSKESSMIKESTKENFKETSEGKIGHTNENSEEVSRTVDKIIDAELDWVNNQIEAQKHTVKKPVGADLVRDVSKNEEAAKVNQEEKIKGRTENTDEYLKNFSGNGDNETTAELNNANSKEVPQADNEKIDFMKYFGQNSKQHEVAQEKTSKKAKREKKLKASPHDSAATVKISKHEHSITEKKLQESDSSKQSLNSPALQISKAQVNATRIYESKATNDIMVSNNNSGVITDNLKEGYMARLAASDDSTEDNTPNYMITTRCGIEKVQNNSPKSKLSKYHGEKLAPATIFDDDDANSGSSVDDFLISSRPNPGKTNSGYSSETDDDSNSGSDGTHISLGSADGKGFNSAFDNPTKSNRISGPISTILRSTSSYRKAKLTASQSEIDDIGSQAIDMVPETQPGSP